MNHKLDVAARCHSLFPLCKYSGTPAGAVDLLATSLHACVDDVEAKDWIADCARLCLAVTAASGVLAAGCVSGPNSYDCAAPAIVDEAGCLVFHVDARVPWPASGVRLDAGKRYRIELGVITTPWVDWFVPATPHYGWSGPWRAIEPLARLKARNLAIQMSALACTTGRSEAPAFAVRDGYELPVAEAAELTCYANDWPGMSSYSNNGGCVAVQVCALGES
jgi:hypothetical protein